MCQKLFIIFVIFLFKQFKLTEQQRSMFEKFNKPLNEPDLSNPLMPSKYKTLCGYRHFPTVFLPKKCLRHLSDDIYVKINRTVRPESRVLKGKLVKRRESPWTVQIVKRSYNFFGQLTNYSHWCTGVLITMKHILTAAHCWEDGIAISVFAGNDLAFEELRRDGLTFYQHPIYNKTLPSNNGLNLENDIGIIILDVPFSWGTQITNAGTFSLNTICLPKPENKVTHIYTFNRPQKATFFGWGRFRAYDFPKRLLRGDVYIKYILSDTYEYKSYERRAFEIVKSPETMELRDSKACKGDSGSGLVQYLNKAEDRAVLVGIMRSIYPLKADVANPPCDAQHIGYAAATRVVRHLSWIYQVIGQT